MSDIEQRKNDHLDIVLGLETHASSGTTGLEDIRFVHNALPELDLSAVKVDTAFLGKSLAAPILISSMTGGPSRSVAFNRNIAAACNSLGLGFGVGSQRIALEGGSDAGFGRDLRLIAPNALILANFGAAQLNEWNGADMAQRAVEMIGADGLIIHLNPLQEAVQTGGDTNWSGLLRKIEEVCAKSCIPIVCKEVGGGISAPVAQQLVNAGVSAIDVAGAGGTSWVAVEAERAPASGLRGVAEPFLDWGIPTARAIADVRRCCPDVPVIASGGIRDGLDCAKAVRLGADVVGLAAGVLQAAMQDEEKLVAQLDVVIAQLRIACFCTGSGDLSQLRRAALLDPPAYIDGA